MGERKRKEIEEYRVDEKTRTVKAYVKTLSESAEKTLELYKKMGYKVIMLNKEKPKSRATQRVGKEEMKKYLKGKIDNEIYKKLVEKLDKKEKFFEVRAWLKEELQQYAKRTNKKYIPANTIIQVEMENEKITTEANVAQYIKDNKILGDKETDQETE